MATLALNFGHWITGSVFPTYTEFLKTWRPQDIFRFDPISDKQEETTLYEIIFAPPYLFYFFRILNPARYVRGRQQTSHVRKTSTIHLKAKEDLRRCKDVFFETVIKSKGTSALGMFFYISKL